MEERFPRYRNAFGATPREEFETELPIPVFDQVDPAPAIKDHSKATMAVCTSGGIVPRATDGIQSASAQNGANMMSAV